MPGVEHVCPCVRPCVRPSTFQLPHVNPTATREHSNRVPGRTIFTQEIVCIIRFVDGPMFAEFGYTRRNDVPFQPGAS